MDNCCRICRRNELKDCFSLNYQSDFHSQSGETVLEMLNFMTGLNVSLEDTLPQQLCRVCTGTVVAGYEFRNLCIESDTIFRQILQIDDQKQSHETDHNDLESCLSLEQIKLEPSLEVEDTGIDIVETDSQCNVEGSADRFYCCFPNCNVNYQFEELLTEHAESDHQLEKESNAINCIDSEFRCIVCARAFANEVDLLQHRNHENTTLQSDSNSLLEPATYAHNKAKYVCLCGYRTYREIIFKRHQAKCALPKVYATLDNIPDPDKTNDEIIAMGFILNRTSTMFYCCISQCATVCETQEQLCDHFQQLHPKEREENMQRNIHFEKVFRCLICCTGFSTEKRLKIHLENAYNPTFRCKNCRYYSLSRKNAVIHALTPCGAQLHRCSCGYSTPYTSAIRRHMSRRGCPTEGSSLRNFKIKAPRTSEKEELPYKCQHCEKYFHNIASLRRHTESELSRALAKQETRDPGLEIEGSAQKQYTCCWCKTITDDSNHLVQCMLKAEKDTGEDIGHKCPNCYKNFKKYNMYLDHRNSKVCLQKSWLSCQPCGVKFASRNSLSKHMSNMHHKIKPTSVPKSKVHARVHECKDCHSQFVTAYTLKRHRKRLHNVEETCGESETS